MLAQAIFEDRIVRVSDRRGKLLAKLPMNSPVCQKSADKALMAVKIKRRRKWTQTAWGAEAKVRFVR